MSKSIKIYIAILLVLFVTVIYFDANKPKPIDWTPTYSLKDKNPSGLYVLDNELNDLFKNQVIDKIKVSPYEYFCYKYDEDTLVNTYKIKGNFLNISDYTEIDNKSISEICSFVSHGNSAFISSKNFPESLLDTLKIDVKSENIFQKTICNWVANKHLGNQKYLYKENISEVYFNKIDTLSTTILGYQSGDSTRVNYIKVPYVDGNFYLHTQPNVFTNYYLLKNNNKEYAEKVLSYLPKSDIFWFVKNQSGEIESGSPLRYIFSKTALKWAWYILIFGLLLFIIFNAKRKQRVIPIVVPLRNTTIEFTKTIGNLYMQEANHDHIIEKKIIYFLEKIRNQYLLETNKLDDDFINKLHQKSGKNLADIQKVVFLINYYKKSAHTSIASDLIELNNAIDKFAN